MIDLDDLLAEARAATPGPWEADLDIFDSAEGIVTCVTDKKIDLLAKIGTDLVIQGDGNAWTAADSARRDEMWRTARVGQELRDAEYIAAASPDVILELVARIRVLEAALIESLNEWAARLDNGVDRPCMDSSFAIERIAELKALLA